MDHTKNQQKNRSDDRLILLQPMEDKPALNSTGMVDKRLFTGENKLHALKVLGGNMWTLKYDSGNIPPPLRQNFTSFGKLMTFVTEYFKRRNINVTGVEDVWS